MKTVAAVAALLLLAACAGTSDEASSASEGALAATAAPASLELALTISESKEVYSSHVDAFAIKGATSLPCHDEAFYLSSKASLYEGTWSPAAASSFAESEPGAQFHEYVFASCRAGDAQVLGWFGASRQYELTVSDQLVAKDYDAAKLPLLLQYRNVGSDPTSFYACDSAFSKKQIGETATATRYEIAVTCKARSTPTKAETGPIDFITNPGIYAAVGSYREWMLPPVPSTPESFARVRAKLLGKVPAGKYTGAMSTLSKTCDLGIDASADGKLVVDHTIVSSDRTRHFDLGPADLLGFTEGDLYADPLRPVGPAQGTYAAAQFADGKGGSFVLRFESNTTLDAKIVRVNGPETYCRRLVTE